MAELFSLDGLAEKHAAIKNLSGKLGFDIYHDTDDRGIGIVFLSFRPEAPKIIMIISGTHGVEGPAGYDLQLNLLEKRVHEKLPDDVGLVFVVALNPWGWVNGRRTDENNVDLNRNGWWSEPPDLPPLDPEINALANPDECDEAWYRKLATCLADPVATARLRAQVFRGQYDNPKGIFYGGCERAWSLAELEIFCRNFLADTCRQLAVLDIHTGIGEWGEITLISSAGKDNPELVRRCQSWFGLNVVFPNLGQTDVINVVSSDLLTFLARCLPEMQVTGLAVEIGTDPFEESFPIFVAENWLRHADIGLKVFLGKEFDGSEGREVYEDEFDDPMLGGIFYPPIIGKECEENWLNRESLGSIILSGLEWSAVVRAGFGPIFRTVVHGLAESS